MAGIGTIIGFGVFFGLLFIIPSLLVWFVYWLLDMSTEGKKAANVVWLVEVILFLMYIVYEIVRPYGASWETLKSEFPTSGSIQYDATDALETVIEL